MNKKIKSEVKSQIQKIKIEELKAEIKELKKENNLLVKEYSKLYDVVFFYADPNTYFATSLMCDRPCGEISTDYSNSGNYMGVRLGKRARKALKLTFDWEEEK